MKAYFILIEAARVISTTVIMIIITKAICVFSALFFFFLPSSPDEVLPQGLQAAFTQEAKLI